MSSVPVFNSMQQPKVKTWGGVVTAAMVIALAVYMGTGECAPPRAKLGELLLSLFVPKFPGTAFLGTALHSQHIKYWPEPGLSWASSHPNERCIHPFIQQPSVGA